jgi:ABC-type antimicrobial peptide transport system permease subunit
LLLGAFGVAAAQMRNVFERRRELALLRAVGFSRGRVGSAVLTENLALLTVGLLLGAIAAGAAALPQVFLRGLDAPWGAIGALAVAIVGVGAITSWLATRFLFRLPLLTALRGE